MHQKLDFSLAVQKSKDNQNQLPKMSDADDLTSIIGGKTLFICFVDPDNDSPTSEGRSDTQVDQELRCPHFRNKCGIKRLVQTSKIGYSTFSSAEEVFEHNIAVHQAYKFKCSAPKCKQRFKTK